MKKDKTARWLTKYKFEDVYRVSCSLQKSSSVKDQIWLGCDDADPKQLILGEGWRPISMPREYAANTRMLLSRKQVKDLLPILEKFVKTGDI